MLNVLLSLLILAILSSGAYYAAHYVVQLRHERDTVTDEFKRATDYINELESRVTMLEAERDTTAARLSQYRTGDSTGWEQINIRG